MTIIYVERESHTSDARFSALTIKDRDDNQRVIGSDYPLPSAEINHVRLHEGITVTSGGTLFVPINRNRVSTATSSSGVLINPNLTLNNTVIYEEYLAAGDSKKETGAGAYSFEYVLKSNTSYLFRLTNVGTVAAATCMSLEWYE